MSVLVDCPEVLNDSHSSVFLVHNKNWAVELAPRRSHYPQFQQLFNVLLDSLALSFRNSELLDEDRIFSLQFNVMLELTTS